MKTITIYLMIAPFVLASLSGCNSDVAANVPAKTLSAHNKSLSRIYFQSEKSIFCVSEAMDVKECNIEEGTCKTVLVIGGKINAISTLR